MLVERRLLTYATLAYALLSVSPARAVAQSRYMYTVAGSPRNGLAFSGDNGPAILAGLYYPSGVAVDAAGNIFIADSSNNRIRKVSSSGTITTVAGNGSGVGTLVSSLCSRNGDGGPAISAVVSGPASPLFDTAGDLIFLDGCGIRKIDTSGIISSVATIPAFSAALGVVLGSPPAISFVPGPLAIDSANNIYITVNDRVLEVSPTGSISLIAGNGAGTFSGDGGPATQAGLPFAAGIAVDSSGAIYVCEPGPGNAEPPSKQFPTAIRKIANGTITTLISIPQPPNTFSFGSCNLALDSAQNLYISSGNLFNEFGQFIIGNQTFNNEVRVLSLTSGALSVFAGTGSSGAGIDGASATSGGLWGPGGMALDAFGNLYIADGGNQRVVVVTSTLKTLQVVASSLPGAYIGKSYSAPLFAQFGFGPYSNWTVTAGGLPAGLLLNSSTGMISGTPTGDTGVSSFTVQVTDSSGDTATASFQITTAPPLIITTFGTLPNATAGASYSFTLVASGGFPAYTNWVVKPGILPLGLSLNAAAGVLSGVPFGAGVTYSFTVSVTDSNGATVSAPVQLTVITPSLGTMMPVGSFAQIASGEEWSTNITLVNPSSTTVNAQINLYDDNGNALVLPLSLGLFSTTASTLTATLGPNQTIQVRTAASPFSISSGWANILATASLNGFATYNFAPAGSNEGTAPLVAPSQTSIILPFDQTNDTHTGVAIANATAMPTSITAIFLNPNGAQIGSIPINLPAMGHMAFFLDAVLPASANNVGAVQFQSSVSISAAGFDLADRFPTQFRSSSIQLTAAAGGPAMMAPVGALPQIVAGAGWSTQITLVNISTTTVNAQINLFDNNGDALVLPLSVPQFAFSTTASSVAVTLGPGETVQVRTAASTGAIAVGWASISATAPLGGFSTYAISSSGSDEEGTAPLAAKSTTSITLPFDQTNGGHTGVAIANLTTAPAAVTATFVDQNGVQIGSAPINLPPMGHAAFFLDAALPASANNFGMVQFQSSQNIAAMGLQFDSNETFTGASFPPF